MSTENNGYLDSDQTIVNFAIRELGISFEQLLNDDPNRMLRNWLKCRKTAKGTAIGTTIMGAIGVMGAVVTGATPLLIAGLAVAGISGLMVKQHGAGENACSTELDILDQCRPILTLLVQLERRGANRSDLVSTYDRLIRAAASHHLDVQDKDRLQAFFQRELEQVAVFSQVAAGMTPPAQQPTTPLQPEALPAAPGQQREDELEDSEPDGSIEPVGSLPATQIQQSAADYPTFSTLNPIADTRFDWAKDLLNFPAVLIWGSQGSGKTSFTAWLLHQRIKAGHSAEVWDVHREFGQWDGLPVFGDGMDYEAVDRRMLAFEQQVKADYKERANNPKYNPKRHTIICEEFTNFARRCEHSAPFFEASLSDLRKVKKGVIFVSHGRSLAAMGSSQGFAQTRNNGLLELHLEAIIDPATGDPKPAMKGKLKLPGKAAIDVEISPDMCGSMDFTHVASSPGASPPVASEQQQLRNRLEDLYQGKPPSDPPSTFPEGAEAGKPPSGDREGVGSTEETDFGRSGRGGKYRGNGLWAIGRLAEDLPGSLGGS